MFKQQLASRQGERHATDPHLHGVEPLPGRLPSEQLPQHHAVAVHVSLVAVALAAQDLRSHPLWRAACKHRERVSTAGQQQHTLEIGSLCAPGWIGLPAAAAPCRQPWQHTLASSCFTSTSSCYSYTPARHTYTACAVQHALVTAVHARQHQSRLLFCGGGACSHPPDNPPALPELTNVLARALLRPKSVILTLQRSSTRILGVLRSRCMIGGSLWQKRSAAVGKSSSRSIGPDCVMAAEGTGVHGAREATVEEPASRSRHCAHLE
jgi:hypothetical protein